MSERDQVGNILIRKPATAGMENRKPVVLAGPPRYGAAKK